jgi:hypothetical protein
MYELTPIVDGPVFKAIVTDGETPSFVDAIEYEHKIWLVLKWLYPQTKEWREPERLIRVVYIELQDLRENPNRQADFFLPVPLPKVLFEASPQLPSEQYVVIEHPHVRFSIPKDLA